jgi:uncharacterized protein
MSVKIQVDTALKQAMIAKDEVKKSTLRAIKTKIMQLETAKGATELDDSGVLSAIASMVKQREESVTMFKQGNRPELAAQEEAEIAVLQDFLPKHMSRNEIKSAVESLVSELGASSMKDMGKVVNGFKTQHPNKADGKLLAEVVKEALNSI